MLLWLLGVGTVFAAEVYEQGIRFTASRAEWIRETAPALLRTRDRLFFHYGRLDDSGLTVEITGSREEFLGAIGGRFPDWGVAAALSSELRIILQAPGTRAYIEPYSNVVGHEYGHIYLHLLSGGSPRIPRWLNEGFAMHAGFEWTVEAYLRLARASISGRLLPLPALDRVNQFGGEKAALAYTESFAAYDYLQDNYGRQAVVHLAGAFADGASPEEAFWRALGVRYDEFSAAFVADVQRRYSVTSLFIDGGLIWALLALLIIIGWLIKRRRAKDVERRWRIEDRIHGEPDFNEYVDPNDDESWRGGGPQV